MVKIPAQSLCGMIFTVYIRVLPRIFAPANAFMLKEEFQYYLDNQDELVKKYNGKFLVITGQKVVGSYDSNVDAFIQSKDKYAPGTFLIQRCSPGNSDYTQTFHSRVSFA